MIGTVEENVKKAEMAITSPYYFTGTREWNRLMKASKFYDRYTFDTVSNALEMAFYCGFVNGHIATVRGDYRYNSSEKKGENNE